MQFIIQTLTSALISFVLVILLGEPIKHYLRRKWDQKEIASKNKELIGKLKNLMPDLLKEMKEDLKSNPSNREFIIMNQGLIYSGDSIVYYFEDHNDLKGKLNVLENHNLISDVTYNNVDRFRMSEGFVELLNISD